MLCVIAMRKIESGDVDTFFDKFFDGLITVRSGAYGGDDLGLLQITSVMDVRHKKSFQGYGIKTIALYAAFLYTYKHVWIGVFCAIWLSIR
jgi:hypothetical protein